MLPALEEESLLMCYQKSGLGPYRTESDKPDHECQRIQQASPAGWKWVKIQLFRYTSTVQENARLMLILPQLLILAFNEHFWIEEFGEAIATRQPADRAHNAISRQL